jgi:hypothetical protein
MQTPYFCAEAPAANQTFLFPGKNVNIFFIEAKNLSNGTTETLFPVDCKLNCAALAILSTYILPYVNRPNYLNLILNVYAGVKTPSCALEFTVPTF